MCCVSAVLFGNVLHDDDPCFLQVVYLPSIPCRAEIAWRVRIRNNCAPGGALANRDVNCYFCDGWGLSDEDEHWFCYYFNTISGAQGWQREDPEYGNTISGAQGWQPESRLATRSAEHKVGSPRLGALGCRVRGGPGASQ